MVRQLWFLGFAGLFLSLASATDCSGTETALDMVNGLDLSGKTYVITGGDAGLGYETALALASAKAKVILACRSHTKCPAAVAKIMQSTGNKDVSTIPLDLSSFDSVRNCTAAIKQQVSHIDVLINNAGLLINPSSLPEQTKDGFDRVYQVNFLSLHLFVQELLPVLRSSGGRVINVASTSSYVPCLWGRYLPNCERLDQIRKVARETPSGMSVVGTHASNYGMTKYLDVFVTAELAHREQNITAFSLHPGVVTTDLVGGVSKLVQHAWCLKDGQRPCPRTAPQGATTQTYLAVAPNSVLSADNGKFFDSCKVHSSVRDQYANSHGEAEALKYQAAIYDMASDLISPKGNLMV
jgi:NAD(P)-dependent dehydrogenase (short-subunit alcohol dehydrogenase family)